MCVCVCVCQYQLYSVCVHVCMCVCTLCVYMHMCVLYADCSMCVRVCVIDPHGGWPMTHEAISHDHVDCLDLGANCN